MNPLVKLFCAAPAIVVATLSLSLIPSLVFALTIFAVAFLAARLPVLRFSRTLGPYLVVAFGFLWFYSFATSRAADPTLLALGPVRVTPQSLEIAVSVALRVVTIMSLTVVFIMTTTPKDLILSLIHQARMDQRLAFGMFAAIRFMPIVEVEMTKIRQAHQIRGVGERDGWFGAWRRFRRYSIPLLGSIIRMAQRTALAMDLKAFGAYDDRTYMYVTRIGRLDVVASAMFIGFIALATAVLLFSGLWNNFDLRNLQGQPGR